MTEQTTDTTPEVDASVLSFEVEAGKKEVVTEDTNREFDGTFEEPEDTSTADAEEGNEPDNEEDAADPPEDLGEFSEDDVERWDTEYRAENGDLDMQRLSAEWWANVSDEDTVDGTLNEGTYAYLAKSGIPKEMVKEYESALRAQRVAEKAGPSDADAAAADMALFERAGGPDKLQAALAWGKEKGYTAAQQERFNAVIKGDDAEAKADAVDLLMSRYSADPEVKAAAIKAAKPSTAARDVTRTAATKSGAVKPFASREAYREADKGATREQQKANARRAALGFADEKK